MPTTKIPGTEDSLYTSRIEPGHYNVRRNQKTVYRIKKEMVGWVVFQRSSGGEWLPRGSGKDTLAHALDCAAARAEHDRLWADYQRRLADYEEHKARRLSDGQHAIRFTPRPHSREIDTKTGPLHVETKIVATRLGTEIPAFDVLVNGKPMGQIILVSTTWHIVGTNHWYAGPNHEWCNLRHGGDHKLPEDAAAYLARSAMSIVIRRYMQAEIERRDAQVAKEQERHASG